MSAFICSPEHIKVLAIFAALPSPSYRERPRVDPRYIERLRHAEHAPPLDLANIYADTIYQENVRSVQHRYPDSARDDLPGPCDDPGHVTITQRDLTDSRLRVPAVTLLKLANCVAYQSCETDDWNKTTAYELLDRIRDAAIAELPGYDDAPWTFDLPARRAAA